MIAKRCSRRPSVWLAALGLWGMVSCWAEGAEREALPAALANARFYAWGMVGTPGQISIEEMSARGVARKWSLQNIRYRLLEANIEGRLYLLCVVRRNYPDEYQELKNISGIRLGQKVTVFSGSVLQNVDAGALMEQFERSRCEPLGWSIDGKAP